MNDKRYFLKTSYETDGTTHASVMERKQAYHETIEIESYAYEWRACKRINELIKQAHTRGEQVIYNPKYIVIYFLILLNSKQTCMKGVFG